MRSGGTKRLWSSDFARSSNICRWAARKNIERTIYDCWRHAFLQILHLLRLNNTLTILWCRPGQLTPPSGTSGRLATPLWSSQPLAVGPLFGQRPIAAHDQIAGQDGGELTLGFQVEGWEEHHPARAAPFGTEVLEACRHRVSPPPPGPELGPDGCKRNRSKWSRIGRKGFLGPEPWSERKGLKGERVCLDNGWSSKKRARCHWRSKKRGLLEHVNWAKDIQRPKTTWALRVLRVVES